MRIGDRKLGPQMTRFVVSRMSVDALNGTGRGIVAVVEFLQKPGSLADSARRSLEWCDQAIHSLRGAQEPNPFKTADEETIAAEVNRKLHETKGWPLA